MIARFSAYGFLKNQRYFEPFIILVFLEKGLSFFAIGILVAIRELVVNLTEVASGAFADVYGRRLSMVGSFVAYIASFVTFTVATSLPTLAAAMVLYGVGDAFRSGTHKAMIFTWLRLEGRQSERTAVYGYTRSWSQIGSAVSVVIATALVVILDSYASVFVVAIVPYALNIVNLATYPSTLDAASAEPASLRAVYRRLASVARRSLRDRPLRGLIIESMGFEGTFTVAKDYLQPALKLAVVGASASWLVSTPLSEAQQVAVAVGLVYVVVFLLSAWGSRKAEALRVRFGDEERASAALWAAFFACFALVLGAEFGDVALGSIVALVVLHVLQNVWRPLLIARFDSHCDDAEQATVLSVEHQAKSLAAMVAAPVVGYAVDATGSLWPVAAMGLAAAALGALASSFGAGSSRPKRPEASAGDHQ